MNTYAVTKLSDVPAESRKQVRDEVIAAFADGMNVSVRLETIYYPDGTDETVFDGVYSNTIEWVDNYYQNGGQWSYSSTFSMDVELDEAVEPNPLGSGDEGEPTLYYLLNDKQKELYGRITMELDEFNGDNNEMPVGETIGVFAALLQDPKVVDFVEPNPLHQEFYDKLNTARRIISVEVSVSYADAHDSF